MPRLPFDPKRVAGPSQPVPGQMGLEGAAGQGEGLLGNRSARRERSRYAHLAEAQHLTVSQVSELIKTTLEERIASPIRVIGEVSNLSAKNHWYFSLKDEAAVLSCVAWATAARKFGFVPRDGDEVIATGHISHYAPQGRTQLYVSQLVPVGAGALELRFRALCEELRQLGYFDESRKKLLPVFPRRIAVITSATGAAIHDVINTAAQRCKAVSLLLVDVRVQGDGAANDVAKAIRWVDRHRRRLGVDAILVTRGGGSIEDLWAFNERVVADAVFNCSLPVVAAIGHESDTTIIELVADVRASTPTQAVMRLVPSSQELSRHLSHLQHRLGFVLHRAVERAQHGLQRLTMDLKRGMALRLSHERARLERLASEVVKLQPREQLSQRRARLAVLIDRLRRSTQQQVDQRTKLHRMEMSLRSAIARHVERQRYRLGSVQRQLTALDPHGVLKRGYSLTARRDGTLVRSVHDVRQGEQIVTRLADGSIESIVGVRSTPPGTSRTRKPDRRKSAPRLADQMDLFGA